MKIGPDEWSGFDTETHEGRAVLCCTESEALIFPKSFPEIADWLLRSPGRKYATWNLDYDIQAILGYLDPETLTRLTVGGKVKLADGYLLEYLRGKRFRLTSGKGKGKQSISVYDGMPFVQSSLATASVKLLGRQGKIDIPSSWYENMKGVLSDPAQAPAVIEYCKADAATALAIMAKLGESFIAIGCEFSEPLSPGYLAGRIFGPRIPSLEDSAQYLFHHGYYGGRVEIWQRGNIGPCTGYDIRSAYPAAMAAMTGIEDTAEGACYSPDAQYGCYLAAVGCPDPLLPYRPAVGATILYSVGKWIDWYSRPHIELLLSQGADVEILHSIETYSNGELLFPEMSEWFKLRKVDPVKGIAYKLCLNSAYGKTSEIVKKYCKPKGAVKHTDILLSSDDTGGVYRPFEVPGRFTNFAMAGHITASCQAKLTAAAMLYPERSALLATDGLLMQGGPIELANTGPDLGQWAPGEYHEEGVIIGCGFYALRSGSKWDTKSRGVIPKGEFHTWFGSEDSYLRIKGLRGESLAECMRRGDYSRLNWLRETIQKKNVNADDKRGWNKQFKSAKECLSTRHTSQPLLVWESEKESFDRLSKQKRWPKGLQIKGVSRRAKPKAYRPKNRG